MNTVVWDIHMLGGLRASGLGRDITRFRTTKTAGLFAYLAYHSERLHPREVVVELLWPGMSPEAGRNNLSTALSSLRHQLEPPGLTLGSVIAADRYSIGLTPGAVSTDARTFFELVESAKTAADDLVRAAHQRAALDLCNGALLPGHYDEWVILEQRRVEDAYYETLHALVLHLASRRNWDDAVRYARQGVARDPLREDARYDLVRSLAVSGRTVEALREYRECVSLWERELGYRPGPQITRIGEALEQHRSEEGGDRCPREWPDTPPHEQRRAARSRPALNGPITFVVTQTDGGAPEPEQTDTVGSAQSFHAAGCALVPFAHPRDAATHALGAAQGQRPCIVLDTIDMGASSMSRAPSAEPSALEVGLRLARALLDAGYPGQVLCSERTAAMLRRLGQRAFNLRELGIYRIAGAGEPERIFELDSPDSSGSRFPGLRALSAESALLPPRLTRFFGREDEIEALNAILAPEAPVPEGRAARLVTLLGSPGCGKTRLGLEVAAAMVEPYGGAVGFVEMAGISDPLLVPGALLTSFGIPASPSVDPYQQLAAGLADRPSLLVLDNAEHLFIEGAATGDIRTVVDTLLRRVAGIRVMVTSRRALGLPGERCFPVLPLPYLRLDEQGHDTEPVAPECLAAYASVRLFVDRAQSVRPDFEITRTNADAVARLCERLEGIPLAIELAAARCHVLSPSQLHAQLTNGLSLEVGRRWQVAPRHRTLQDAIAWSLRLLAPEIQRFLCRLSVFRGGWTDAAAESVCEEPLALDYLALLAESSLITTHEQIGSMRFSILEMVREMADAQMTAAERADARCRHATYYAYMAEASEPLISGDDPAPWLDALDLEMHNLRAALDWGLSPDGNREAGARILASLDRFWQLRDHEGEALARMRAYLEQQGSSARQYGLALAAGAELAWRSNDERQAQMWADQALSYARASGDTSVEARALGVLGALRWVQGDAPSGLALAHQSIDAHRSVGDSRGVVRGLLLCLRACDDPASEPAMFGEAVALARQCGDTKALANCHFVWGQRLAHRSRHAEAIPLLTEAVAMFRRIKDTWGTSATLLVLGWCLVMEGDDETGCARIEEGMRVAEQRQDPWSIAVGIGYLRSSHRYRTDLAAFIARCRRALPFSSGFPYGTALIHGHMADACADAGQWAEAQQHTRHHLGSLRHLSRPGECLTALERHAQADRETGHLERAARVLAAVSAIRAAMGLTQTPEARAQMANDTEALRVLMGATAFDREWAIGVTMDLDTAIASVCDGPTAL